MLTEKAQHRLAQRRFVENDFEELACRHRRRPDHAHDVVRLAEQQRIESRRRWRATTITLRISTSCAIVDGHVGRGQQPALVAHFHGHRARADAGENAPRQAFRNHAARGGIEHERGGVGGRQPVVEPVQAKVGDQRHVDQHFRQHHENDGEEQQLAGQADAQPARAVRRGGCFRRFDLWAGFRFQCRLDRGYAGQIIIGPEHRPVKWGARASRLIILP